MTGAQYFTKLDALNTFWQIRMDEENSKLLTFNSPCSHFRFLLIQFGIHIASEMCQACIAAIIESIEGCRNARDDIIIWADAPELLEKRTTEVLQAVRIKIESSQVSIVTRYQKKKKKKKKKKKHQIPEK